MRMRSSKVRFEDFFSPADFAHVNWLEANGSSLLAGLKASVGHSNTCADCQGEACESCTREAEWLEDRVRAPIDREAGAGVDGEGGPAALRKSFAEAIDEHLGDAAPPRLGSGGPWLERERVVQDADTRRDAAQETRETSFRRRLEAGAAAAVERSGNHELRTLEYVPERDAPVETLLVARTASGRVKFTPDQDPIRYTEGYDERGRRHILAHEEGTIETERTVNGQRKRIPARRNKSDDRNYDTNCHGFVFASGEVWINNEHVDDLLEGDCYQEIPEREARVGDVVIYRGPSCQNRKLTGSLVNVANHSAVLRGRDKQGWQVEGKRGTASRYPVTSNIDQQWNAADQCGVPPRKEFWRKTHPCR